MAFDAFMKIEGIPGESTDDKHKDWIEIVQYNEGLSQPAHVATSASGSRTTGRVEIQDFAIVKAIDKATPKLALYCCNGTHIPTITIELCRAGGDKQKYMEYKLADATVSSVRTGGSAKGGDALPLEEVTFRFAKIEWTYTALDMKTGKAKGNVAAQWDLSANKGA